MPTRSQIDVDAEAERIFANDPEELRKYRRLVHKQEQQETPTVKKSKCEKAAAKSLRKSLAQNTARRTQSAAKSVLVKSVENAVLSRISQLERQLATSLEKAVAQGLNPNGAGGQEARSLAYLLHRERGRLGRFAKGVPDTDDFAAVARFLDRPAATEAQRSTAATARAIGNAQGESISQHLGAFISGPREALQSILDNTGRPESLQTTEIQVKKLRKQLADEQSPAERERLGYELTRKQLLLMHVRGEG